MIEVGKYSIVSLQEAVESAKEMLRLQDTTEFDGFLLRKADEAMRHIGDDTTYAKRACTLDIIDGRAKLPMGFIRLSIVTGKQKTIELRGVLEPTSL